MSVEFVLGHQDHHKVEDFLASRPDGVASIRLHPKYAHHQTAAAAAAREAAVDVLWDPRSERLPEPDPDGRLVGLPGAGPAPLQLNTLAGRASARQELVRQVVEAHPEAATIVTPPSFFISDERTARLVVDLADLTRMTADRPVRARLLVASTLPQELMRTIAIETAKAGIRSVELQVSPTLAERDGIRKIRLLFGFCDILRSQGLHVVLGHAGNVGHAAVALGHAHAYSVGIGQDEHVDHKSVMRRQVSPPPKRYDENGHVVGGGAWQGVYLPPLALTVSSSTARSLLEHSDIRTRIGCRIGRCAESVNGPVLDQKTHYLHARTAEMAAVKARPEPWRATQELGRLRRALELRGIVNAGYRPTSAVLPTRTISGLLEAIEEERTPAIAH